MRTTAATADSGALRLIDEDFLKGVQSGAPEYVTTLEPRLGGDGRLVVPHVDLEVISDPHIDAPDHSAEDELTVTFLRRCAALRAPFGKKAPHLVITRGSLAIEPDVAEPLKDRVWDAALDRVVFGSARRLDVLTRDTEERAAVFLVRRPTGGGRQETWGVVVVLSVPQPRDGEERARGTSAERLIRTLTESIARNAPLYVVGVDRGDKFADVAPWCRHTRTTLLLARGHARSDMLSVSQTLLDPGLGPTEFVVVPCPGFKPGTGVPGLTRVRIDVDKGEAAIVFRRDLGSDQPPEPVQVVQRLQSASRVSAAEQRLHGRIGDLLQVSRADGFAEHAAKTWEQTGYAALCDRASKDDRESPGTLPIKHTREETYNLLLLLRERNDRYELLLSNHSPLRISALANWDTLLMPAFKSAHELLEHLRDDVVRQVRERAQDFERAEHAGLFERAVSTILLHEQRDGQGAWEDQLREVATRAITKISPTTGLVTRFDYHLVTLLPLVSRDSVGQSDEVRQACRTLIWWLDRLECVRIPDDGLGAAPGLPIDALMQDGCGLRWDPASRLVEEPNAVERRRARRAYPGLVWFPIDFERPLWKRCPALVARNADVMTWVNNELNARRDKVDRRLPDELLLGRASAAAAFVIEQRFPFAPVDRWDAGVDLDEGDEPKAWSTTEALELVRLSDKYDLGDVRPYAGASVRRVWVIREPSRMNPDRSALFVYSADKGIDFKEARVNSEPLGMLRPVQRYVLRAGLERSAALEKVVAQQGGAAFDPWGYVRIRKGAASKRVSLTPPIIEQLHSVDADDGGVGRDFIVCDGNHRIVHRAWNGRRPVAAVAVMPDGVDDLPEPYYARPFGRLEWDMTAENELLSTPSLSSKYAVRRVDRGELLKDMQSRLARDQAQLEDTRRKLAGTPDSELYRRYFRNLEEGFGSLGGQGGRYA